MSIISRKHQAIELVLAGGFGNKLRFWRNIEDLWQSGYTGKVSIRTLIGGNGKCKYACELHQIESTVKSWKLNPNLVYFNEDAPDESLVIQGEFLNELVSIDSRVYNGTFVYSMEKTKMRTAIRANPSVAYGYKALNLIRSNMTPSSWSDFEMLLDQYPGHVLELSIYSKCLGDIPGRNALVWEIRRY